MQHFLFSHPGDRVRGANGARCTRGGGAAADVAAEGGGRGVSKRILTLSRSHKGEERPVRGGCESRCRSSFRRCRHSAASPTSPPTTAMSMLAA